MVKGKQANCGVIETWRRCFKMERIVYQVKLRKMKPEHESFRLHGSMWFAECTIVAHNILGMQLLLPAVSSTPNLHLMNSPSFLFILTFFLID